MSRRSSLCAVEGPFGVDCSVLSRPAALPNEARISDQARNIPSPTSLAPWRSGSDRSHTCLAASVERARMPLWEYFQRVRSDPERGSIAALSLSVMGDMRVLPFLRMELGCRSCRRVANAVAAMVTLGELEDVERLRAVHHRYLGNEEIRSGVANAILAILSNSDTRRLERTLEQIRTNFEDRALWGDLWTLLDNSFGLGS